LDEFDRIISKMGYDRSKALQLAMRNFIAEYKWGKEEESEALGSLTIIYDHEVQGLEDALTDIQHHYRELIGSAMHLHLSDRECLLVIALRGQVRSIRDLTKEIIAKRGVKQAKLSIVTS